ncbi:hypothetical protein [Staphylococcus phage APTC_SA_4]|nr:hypothetical protein [Staphylococcus phage APTC_SA_4]
MYCICHNNQILFCLFFVILIISWFQVTVNSFF